MNMLSPRTNAKNIDDEFFACSRVFVLGYSVDLEWTQPQLEETPQLT